MTSDSPVTPEPVPAEQPTRAAELEISAEPARVKFTGWRWVTAEGTVPPGDAHHLITAFCILGGVITGTSGAVLTLRIAPGLTTLALAELVLALVGMVLTATCGRARNKPGRRAHGADSREPAKPGGKAAS
jgi:hypothetical protein